MGTIERRRKEVGTSVRRERHGNGNEKPREDEISSPLRIRVLDPTPSPSTITAASLSVRQQRRRRRRSRRRCIASTPPHQQTNSSSSSPTPTPTLFLLPHRLSPNVLFLGASFQNLASPSLETCPIRRHVFAHMRMARRRMKRKLHGVAGGMSRVEGGMVRRVAKNFLQPPLYGREGEEVEEEGAEDEVQSAEGGDEKLARSGGGNIDIKEKGGEGTDAKLVWLVVSVALPPWCANVWRARWLVPIAPKPPKDTYQRRRWYRAVRRRVQKPETGIEFKWMSSGIAATQTAVGKRAGWWRGKALARSSILLQCIPIWSQILKGGEVMGPPFCPLRGGESSAAIFAGVKYLRANEAVDCISRFSLFFPLSPAVMELENDFQEAFTDLDAILAGRSRTTLNVSGGIGGHGGRGGQEGGAGGNGKGPTFNFSRAEGWIVHVNERNPREISLCDINLQREVYLVNSQVNSRRGERNFVRRYCTAEVKDRKQMTVVFYEGEHAVEVEFKEDVTEYMRFRHPSFLQLYGTLHSENVHASIFYDDLIPWSDIESLCQQYPMLPCYVYAYAAAEFEAANDYMRDIFDTRLRVGYAVFLRHSTGRLCIDIEGDDDKAPWFLSAFEQIFPISPLPSIDREVIINALTVEQYHIICHFAFGDLFFIDETESPLTTTVHLGAVYRKAAGHHNFGSPLAIAPTLDTDNYFPQALAWHLKVAPHVMESGWNRLTVSDLLCHPEIGVMELLDPQVHSSLWLSQADHILNCLGSDFEFFDADDYGKLTVCLLDSIEFRLYLGRDHESFRQTHWHSFDGFLFLCPPKSFKVGPGSFRCPDCIGYWSLDPSGLDQLSAEQAAELGFPAISVSILGEGRYWSETVYAGLRQFHQGKGFNPDSQDLARHLGVPLYELYSDYEKSLNFDGGEAHIEEVSSADTDQLGEKDEPGNLEIGEDEQCEGVSKSGDLRLDKLERSEDMIVSSSLKMLALIQLSLMLFNTVLALYGSL
ncbi:hypothetical protein R3P38DRAFT_2775401 [Favolaschia claudopus]|uniref:Uncharacterized protein n=1 Tax=Favolaschia claudopus TaxID=2862362 RepID=A0AAW0BST3_9AGAR